MTIPTTMVEAAELLGVGIDADDAMIRDRYRRLARVYHPDQNPDDEAAGERMLEINAAMELLLADDVPAVEPIIATNGGRALTRSERRRETRVKEALHSLPYGVYVVGSVGADGRPNVMVADWVMQVSFEPRVVCVAFERDATSLKNARATRQLTVNVLPEAGMDLVSGFLQPSDPSKIKGRNPNAPRPDKLRGVPHEILESGAPVLSDALAWVAAEAQQFVPVGGHVLALARVTDGAVQSHGGRPLTSLYTGWVYGG